MGISRNSRHKRRPTGGRVSIHKKKRKYEMGRNPAMTKLGASRVRSIRCRGNNIKFRALRLEAGSYSWGSEGITRKTRIAQVVYNASNNELVRTNTLVKSTIVMVDATPFKQWYHKHYGVDLSRKKTEVTEKEAEASRHVQEKRKARLSETVKLDSMMEEQFNSGRLLACISSRPGQCGRADGYLLEGAELHFYKNKLEKKKAGKN